ncbi:hypothetical protein KM043_016037 [Ampulex compressa]|nr:hypothetical protein KM043_016037 [Ampulex compressa]
MRRTVGWFRLYSNGVAIRVMLEYIDYWGDQRVGDDGMTPLPSSSREKDEGSKQPVLLSAALKALLPPRRPSTATSNLPGTPSAGFASLHLSHHCL